MTEAQARNRFVSATVARLATVDMRTNPPKPHLVPIVFALLDDDTVVSAVDHKPKRTTALRRLVNISANPHVCLLVDRYSDDWTQLWWVRADGRARVVEPGHEQGLRKHAIAALEHRYGQYHRRPITGALVFVEVMRWSGWSAGG